MPSLNHVVIVVEENEDYATIVGNPSMPFLNSLASQYGSATNYYADAHFSIGNYFMLTTGELVTADDGFTCPVTIDNVVRQLVGNGKTWKVYAESLPSAGYTGGDVLPYAKHHNPFAYLRDVLNDSTQKANVVPFTQFSADLSANNLPNYSFVIPNVQNDMHDCPPGMTSCSNNDKLINADRWLQSNIAPLLSNAGFQASGFLVITFDEAALDDYSHGGGKVATVVAGPTVKPGYQSSTFLQHQSVLRSALEALGIVALPGASQYVPNLGEFFQGGSVGSLHGAVSDANSGNGIAGAQVNGPGSASTDAAGNYSFSSVAPGTYIVSASASGYQPASVSVTVSSGSNAVQNFALGSPTTGSFSGKVTSAIDGRALSGASVTYSGGSALTDVNGAYGFGSVTAGNYSVTVTKSGWAKSAKLVSVASGANTTANFQLATSGIISGVVTNSAGSALPGVAISMSGGVIPANKNAVTSTSGAYSSGWVPVGNWTVTATYAGSTQTKTVTVMTGQTVTTNFTF